MTAFMFNAPAERLSLNDRRTGGHWMTEHLCGTMVPSTSEPGVASTTPALIRTCDGGPDMADGTCSVEGCARGVYARSLCGMHYSRQRRGQPLTPADIESLPPRNRPRAPRGVPAETFRHLISLETDSCVEWPHARTRRGYGRVNLRGHTEYAYALACELRNGPPPATPGRVEVAHSCGNPPCINYRHLRWATQAENMADRVEHGVSNRGERSGSHRLTVADVLVIRRRCASGESDRRIAVEYSVHPATIQAIRVRRSWAWLDDVVA